MFSARAFLYADTSYLHETVISTLVAGMLPVNGSNSYTEAMSSSLSITSPSMSKTRGPAQAKELGSDGTPFGSDQL